MAPEYHLESFWDERFKTETHFEWLGDGQETLLPPLQDFLQTQRGSSTTTPRLLHIGAGTSSLSERVMTLYHHMFGENVDENAVVNTDFSDQAMKRGRQLGWRKSGRWERVDVLKWADIGWLGQCVQGGKAVPRGDFSVVLDKSTSDAISCGEDITFRKDAMNHPLINASLTEYGQEHLVLPPLEVLALHLASLVRPGGVWIALSYSSDRFTFLSTASTSHLLPGEVGPSAYWKTEKVEAVEAPSGQDKVGVFAPAVQHHVYVLRRTHVPVTVKSGI